MEFISQPWTWYVAGPLIAIILLLMNYFGRGFGVSSNLETFCTIGGAGKVSDYFKKDWKWRYKRCFSWLESERRKESVESIQSISP